mgnify:CR=1 FL=1
MGGHGGECCDLGTHTLSYTTFCSSSSDLCIVLAKMGAEQSVPAGVEVQPAAPATAAPSNQPDGAQTEESSSQQSSAMPSALVLVGPSGVGKGTLAKRLMDGAPERFGFSVSHTTRAPRPNEQVGPSKEFLGMRNYHRLRPLSFACRPHNPTIILAKNYLQCLSRVVLSGVADP